MAGPRISRVGDWDSVTQVARVDGEGIIELFACARPTRDGGGFVEQARSMYDNLHRLLGEHGARPGDVLLERLYLSDVDRQFHDLRDIRRRRYNDGPQEAEYAPAAIFLHQPPAHPGRLCEVQAYAALSAAGADVKVRTPEATPELASGKVVQHGGYGRFYLMNVTGEGEDFSAEAEAALVRAEACLMREGFAFRDVVRTWFYISDMARDYAAFNRVRTAFYRARGVTRLPASTGIQGTTYPRGRGCAMDLLAVRGERPVAVGAMRAPTMNEAPAYGSAFSRGMRVTLGDQATLYVSGTASINEEGRVVHAGNIEGQARRMLLNVSQLLAAQGAIVSDIVTAITYLKSPGYLDAFRKVCRELAVPEDIPNMVCVADICRPEWLCEIEAVAICPRRAERQGSKESGSLEFRLTHPRRW